MKKLILLVIVFYSCQNDKETSDNQSTNQEIKDSSSNKIEINDTLWINAFRVLRDDIYQKRPEKFIEFPFIDKQKSIWYIIESLGNENKNNQNSLSLNEVNKYYSDIFSKDFTSLLLKTKSEELYLKKEFKIKKEYGDTITYTLHSNYNLEERKLNLEFYYKGQFPKENGEVEGGESLETFVFYFENGKFILKEILLAG